MQLALSSLFQAFLPGERAGELRIRPAAQALQQLQKGATLVVPQPQGVRLTCERGQVWITHDGDCRDIVLAAGERYTSDRGTRMLVHGLEAAAVRLG